MKLALFLFRLLEALLNPGFGPDDAVAMIGEPVRKDTKQWLLRCSVPEISEVTLQFEDLEAGKGLLTTIEVRFDPTWRPAIAELQQTLGASYRWLPATGRGRPRTIAFDRDGEQLKGVIMLTLDPPPRGRDLSQMTIPSALVRRFFPAPAPAEPPSAAEGKPAG